MALNSIRFSGLASGIDTDSMVKAMLGNEKFKIDRQKQQQTLLDWRKDAWKDMNNNINTFYSKYASQLRLQATFEKNKVTVSNPNALDVNTNGNIPSGTHKIEIEKIATGAYMKNAAMLGTSKVDANTTFADLGITEITTLKIEKWQADGQSAGSIEIVLNPGDKLTEFNAQQIDHGTRLILETSNNQIRLTSENSQDDKVTVNVISSNPPDETFGGDRSLLTKLGLGSSISIKEGQVIQSKDYSVIDKSTRLSLMGITNETINLNNGTLIKLSDIGTIGELETALKNADKSLNVNFDVANKRFFVSSKQTGESAKIVITGSEPDLLGKLGLQHDPGSLGTLTGTNAEYRYNDMVEVFKSESNTVTINGMTMTIKAKTDEAVIISATKDAESFVSFIKEFADEYNKLIEDINKKLGADKSRTYSPLSAEQKQSMSESDVQAWEKKIKDSLFSNDPQLKALRDNMRSILSSSDQGGDVYKTLANIGVTTGDWKEMGKLHINDDKLRAAINDNAEAVVALFAGRKSSDGTTIKGIGTKLYESFQSMIKGVTNVKSYSSYYNDITDRQKLTNINKKIHKLEDRYARLEQTYYARFTAMEKSLSQLNNQSSWLSQQVGGM